MNALQFIQKRTLDLMKLFDQTMGKIQHIVDVNYEYL